MIVSQVELVKGEGGAASAVEGLGVAAAHATGEKCERCWKYSATIGSHAAHPTLCARCASVVEGDPSYISGGAPGAKGGAAFLLSICTQAAGKILCSSVNSYLPRLLV